MPQEIQERFAKWLNENFEMAFSHSWEDIIDEEGTQVINKILDFPILSKLISDMKEIKDRFNRLERRSSLPIG